jgi:hypothetical protein
MGVYPPNGYSPARFGVTTDPDRLRLVAPATLAATFFVRGTGRSARAGSRARTTDRV